LRSMKEGVVKVPEVRKKFVVVLEVVMERCEAVLEGSKGVLLARKAALLEMLREVLENKLVVL
jgi:hypothetical protein